MAVQHRGGGTGRHHSARTDPRGRGARAGPARPGRASRAAFTLIELLVVIAILALLLSLLTPSLQQARELAWKATCQGNLHAIGQFNVEYVSAHDGYPYPVFTSVFQEPPTSQYYSSWINLLWALYEIGRAHV